MNNKSKFWLIMSILFLTSCFPQQPAVLSKECNAPCWRQIEPGKTSEVEALQLIQTFDDVNQNEIAISGPWNIFSGFIHFTLITGEVIRIYSINDIVALISFGNPKGLVLIEECINAFDEPTFVFLEYVLGPGLRILPASDAEHTWFFAVYPDKGVSYGYDTGYSTLLHKKTLQEKTKITTFSYFDNHYYERLLEKGFIRNLGNLNPNEEFYPWAGYGRIGEMYSLP